MKNSRFHQILSLGILASPIGSVYSYQKYQKWNFIAYFLCYQKFDPIALKILQSLNDNLKVYHLDSEHLSYLMLARETLGYAKTQGAYKASI